MDFEVLVFHTQMKTVRSTESHPKLRNAWRHSVPVPKQVHRGASRNADLLDDAILLIRTPPAATTHLRRKATCAERECGATGCSHPLEGKLLEHEVDKAEKRPLRAQSDVELWSAANCLAEAVLQLLQEQHLLLRWPVRGRLARHRGEGCQSTALRVVDAGEDARRLLELPAVALRQGLIQLPQEQGLILAIQAVHLLRDRRSSLHAPLVHLCEQRKQGPATLSDGQPRQLQDEGHDRRRQTLHTTEELGQSDRVLEGGHGQHLQAELPGATLLGIRWRQSPRCIEGAPGLGEGSGQLFLRHTQERLSIRKSGAEARLHLLPNGRILSGT